MAEPSSKAAQAAVFTRQLKELVAYSETMEKALRGSGPSELYKPDKGGWSGDLFDLVGMAQAFDREELDEMFRAAVSDPDSPGTVGDFPAIILQGDMVASLERAYRARHATAVRGRAHAAGRHRGHGAANGVIAGGIISYLKSLLRQAAG